MNTPRSQKGMTLIELLTTVAVLSISLTLGVPSFQSVSASLQRDAVATELAASLRFARSEAGRRAAPVSICPSVDGATCAAGNGPEWNTGWITFLDQNGNGTPDLGDTIVSVYRVKSSVFSLTANQGIASGVTFGETGFPTATGSLSYCDAQVSKTLSLGFVGGLRETHRGSGCS
jgi:type IV fimbrial biogenesis protein FimT